ncbi:MAG: M48 family metalloprotease [Pseudomonadota bacterium]
MSRFARPACAALFVLLACGFVPAQPQSGRAGAGLPELGGVSELTSGNERRLGDRIAASIYRDSEYLDDPVLGDYVEAIWLPLLAAARARGELSPELNERFAWQVMLIKNRTVNAFALPGGYLGVQTGLIGVVSSADELAAVLAHELSHVTQRHIARIISKQDKQAPWMIAAILLGVLAANKSPDAANAAIVGGQAMAVQNQLNFSRDMEREADRIGFGVMTDAGFASRGVSGMFEKLQQASRFNDNGAFPYLRSHPLTTERLAEAQLRGQQQSDRPRTAASPAQHAMMAARARVLGEPGVDTLRDTLAQARRVLDATAPQDTAATAGALYGGVFSALRLREFASARPLLARLKSLQATDPSMGSAVRLLAIELESAAGQHEAAAAATDLSGAKTRADLLVQGRALLAAGRAAEVSDKLQSWVAVHPRDGLAWQLLAEACTRQNLTLRAIRADAESRVAYLDYPAALDRLKAAQSLARSQRNEGSQANNHIEASIIDTRTRQVELLAREQALEDKLDR